MRLDISALLHPPSAWLRWMLAPLLALMLLLTACGGSGDSSKDDQARATVLVYVVGSDLEENWSLATENLKEMMQVGSSQEVNIIVETGAADKEGWRTVKRQKVLNGGTELISDLGSQRMTDPANLRKFIEWGVGAYPAKSYHLVFWDHGGGPLGGYGVDRNFPGTSTMSMPELAEALEGAKRTTGATFDLVGFDACLMASAEVAYMLRPYAHYLVASQEIEPGRGWDWKAYLSHVVNDSGSTALSTGKAIVDGYSEKMAAEGEYFVTLSLTDLGKMDALMENLGAVSATIVDKLNAGSAAQQYNAWADLAYTRRSSHDFQTSWLFGNRYDLVDMADFFTKPALRMLDVSEEQVAAVEASLNEAVVYNKYGENLWAAGGMTLYMPLVSAGQNKGDMYLRHAALDVPDSLKSLVTRYVELARSPGLPKPTLGTPQQAGGISYARLNNANFAAVEYANLWNTSNAPGSQHLAIKPLDAQAPPPAGDEVLIAARPDDGWFLLPSSVGPPVLVSVLPDDTPRMAVGYATYTIPVLLRYPGVQPDSSLDDSRIGMKGVLLVEYNEDVQGNKTYRILNFLAGSGASPYASRTDPQGLEEGLEFYPLILVDGEWQADRGRSIVSFDAGDADTPQEDWWQLQTATATELCGAACGFSFGIVDYQGTMTM